VEDRNSHCLPGKSFSVDANLSAQGDLPHPADLSRSYHAIANQGSDWFYRGPFAHRFEQWMKQNGGPLTGERLSHYKIELRRAIITSYRYFKSRLFRQPVPAAVHVAQILNHPGNFELKKFDAATASL